jgi:tetratricopeptide (TPR) repeat protein
MGIKCPKCGAENPDTSVFCAECGTKLLKSVSSKGKGVDSILETQIDELCMEISKTKSTGQEESALMKTNIASVTTHSMEAYKHFIKGIENEYLKDGLARAYEQKGDLDSAVSEYEKMFEFGPGKKERFLPHPKYHYRLAKLYEQKGWKGKAMEHYEKFLTLWKDADPGLTEVEDAKKRLEGLQGE